MILESIIERASRRPRLSQAARSLRLATRITVLWTALMLALSFAASRAWIAPALGAVTLPLSVAGVLTAVWLGIKSHRKTLVDRDLESGRAMIVAIAAQLGKQDNATLERIRGKGGPAGEAAAMILTGRAKAKPGGG